MYEITKQTVNASEGQFEEHPESYRPRVFVAENPDCKDAELVHEVYELLTDGQAIPWGLSSPKGMLWIRLLDDLCRRYP